MADDRKVPLGKSLYCAAGVYVDDHERYGAPVWMSAGTVQFCPEYPAIGMVILRKVIMKMTIVAMSR